MFTDKKFKVKCMYYNAKIKTHTLIAYLFLLDAVDRRGRKVKQSSSEDLRKYYDIDGKEESVTSLYYMYST